MAAIQTVFNGIEYRSRLEARWASFMTNIGWDHIYEPFDGDGYIPDFVVTGPSPLLIEVKPAITQTDLEAAVPKAESGLRAHWRRDVLVVGASPILTGPRIGNSSGITAGWLGEFLTVPECVDLPSDGWVWDAADWFNCGRCGSTSVYHTLMTFNGRPCGCYEGDHYLHTWGIERKIAVAWSDACNDVKWRGRPA